ncbi:MAG: hypothetical protein AAFR50_11535 [Pseudomonadota bacterium]
MSTEPEPAMGESATDISNAMLEETRAAYIACDFERFANCFLFPQLVGTFSGDRVVADKSGLRDVFDAMCAHHKHAGVMDLYRLTINASFDGPDAIRTTFLTRDVLQGHVFGDEVVGHGVLSRVDGRWKILESRYATASQAVEEVLMPRNTRSGHA